MRILHVSPFFSPSMGGAAQIVYQMATHLSRRGHHITVLAGDHGSRASRFPVEGFQEVLLPCISSRWGFYFTPSLSSWVRDHLIEYDIVHLHTVRTYQNIVIQRQAVRQPIPFVISAHGTLPIIVRYKSVKKIYDVLFGKSLRLSACKWIAVSPVEVGQYQKAGIPLENIQLIHNGLKLDEYVSLPDRGLFRKKNLGSDGMAKTILYLGRIDRAKGIQYLLDAFVQLQPTIPDSVLIIAGPGKDGLESFKRYVKQYGIEKKVYFPGPVYGAEKIEALVDADVLVSPAMNEIFGLVAFEALLCGTPVVVCGESGQGQLITQAKAGLTVSGNDVAALENAIFTILSNSQEAKRMTQNGQIFIRENLDWEILIRELIGVYEGVIDSKEPADD